jgi:tetratricopeptide (TPR) repeat protein/predicted Ser/Thr protein kinase
MALNEPFSAAEADKAGSSSLAENAAGKSSSLDQRVSNSESPTILDVSALSNVIPFQSSNSDSDAATLLDATPVSSEVITGQAGVGQASGPQAPSGQFTLVPGMLVGQRYEILAVLGEGGMGAVYKAKDRELSRLVALKVIRPELAANPDILERFKQEILLSSKVTHRNVVRIYDLGDAATFKFITMEYVEGEDLRHLLNRQGKLPVEESVSIIEQVFAGLGAAHREGIIHRDLKPGNIMRDAQGRVVVMDFGLARSVVSDGMTRSGLLVGTMEYMSPEQAQAKELDARSDIFTVGLILYEVLTGKMPYQADSVVASLLKRTQYRAAPVSDHDSAIPRSLSAIVAKCLERDPKTRYQSTADVLADLDNWHGKDAAASLRFPGVGPWGRDIPWPLIGVVAAVLILAVAGFLLRDKMFKPNGAPASAGPAVSLAILPFRNASGDSSLDWLGPSLADMLSTDVGQSAHLRTVSPDRLHQTLTDLQITGNLLIDPTMLHRIADFTSADTVVWGQYAKFGDQIRIDATLQDLKHDRRVPLKIEVPSEKDVPGGVDRLAEAIRKNLGMSDDVVKELQASSFQPTSTSLTALRDYNQGVALLRDGKSVDAQKELEAATKEDPTFALAFSRLAQTYAHLGYDGEAEQSAQKAVALSENLPPAERYLITAIHAQVVNDYPAAIKGYENLAKASPDNADVQSALGRLYEDTGDLTKANEYYQKLIAANPKDVSAIVSSGRIAIKRGKAQDSLDPLSRALSLSIQLGNDEQRSASLHLMGVAYRMLNKPEDALRNFQEALTIRRRTGEKRGIAFSLNEMAVVEIALGKPNDALAHYQEALQVRREIGDKRGLGDTLLDLGNFYDDRGDHDQALKLYKEALQMERDIGNEGLQAICLNNIGAVYYEKAQYEDARTYYQQALQLREKSKVPQDIVESVHNLAETSVRMGQYDQAVTEYMEALDLRRSMNDTRGAAIESYTVGVMFGYQGRFGAALNSIQDALKTFQGLQDKTNWMADISGGYGEALILGGRGQESQPYLETALSLARELKNDGLVSQTLIFQGDAAYYRGDFKTAAGLYQQALQAALRSKEPDRILTAKVSLAKVAVEDGHGQSVISDLRKLMQQADEQGVAHVSLQCSIVLGQALIQNHDYVHAQQELGRALVRTDKLGLKPLSAKANYLLAASLSASGNQAEALDHYREARQLLDAMRKEPGAESILQRWDLKAMYEAASRQSQAAKN